MCVRFAKVGNFIYELRRRRDWHHAYAILPVEVTVEKASVRREQVLMTML